MESVINLIGVQYVFPAHIRESILIQTSGSVFLGLTLLSTSSPFSGRHAIRKWLDELEDKTSLQLNGDINTAFDNNQTFQK